MLHPLPMPETKPYAFSFTSGKEPRTDWNIHDHVFKCFGLFVVRERGSRKIQSEKSWKILLHPLALIMRLCIICFLKSLSFICPGYHFQQQKLFKIKNQFSEARKNKIKQNKSHPAQPYILKTKKLCLKEVKWLVQWYIII